MRLKSTSEESNGCPGGTPIPARGRPNAEGDQEMASSDPVGGRTGRAGGAPRGIPRAETGGLLAERNRRGETADGASGERPRGGGSA